jgi:DNA-binding NarL/FixJ family response regulator
LETIWPRALVGAAAAVTPPRHRGVRRAPGGAPDAAIADRLIVSDATIKTRVARVLMKLGVRDRVQAVILAYESGVVTPTPE